MTRCFTTLLLLTLGQHLAAQAADSSFKPRLVPPAADSVLHQGATVRVRIPSLSAQPMTGVIGRSNSSPGCLAIRLDFADTTGRQLFAFLPAATTVQVDRRTNQGFHSRVDGTASDSDWVTLTKAQIATANKDCHR